VANAQQFIPPDLRKKPRSPVNSGVRLLMPLGERALNPNTQYLVYEFSYNDKVFYVGLAHGHIRHTRRWGHVANLLRHENAGTLKPSKAADLGRKSNQIISALIRAGLPEHTVSVAWKGLGKKQAEVEEAKIIRQRLAEGCLLANIAGNTNNRVTVDEILRYLKVAV
jgi:hypothetical protein